jgi:hypothetical protein
MKIKLAVVAAMIFNVACSGPHPFPCELTVDPSFTDNEVALIASAVDEWESVTGGIAHVEMTIESQRPLKHFIERVENEDEITRSEHSLGYSGIPYETSTGLNATAISVTIFTQRIEITAKKHRDLSYDRLFRGVILHELGHHFGLFHDDNENSLMFPVQNTFCVTTIDIAQFCSIHDCSGVNTGSQCGTFED